MAIPPLSDMILKMQPKRMKARILALDPGETIGWCLMVGGKIEAEGQLPSSGMMHHQLQALQDLFTKHDPHVVVYESYRVYSWKTDDHAWSEVHTAQIIGIIRWFALEHKKPYTSQTAQIAKQFVTDDKLKQWGLYIKGQKHTRDAIRHAVYWTLFGKYEQLIKSSRE